MKKRNKCTEEGYTLIPTFNPRGMQTQKIKTGKDAKNITPEMIRKIRENVLDDCIKNPRKYLEE